MDTRRFRSILFTFITLILTASSAYAQANNGSVGGVVQDASKALIPGVTITLTNTQTGVVDSRLTNELAHTVSQRTAGNLQIDGRPQASGRPFRIISW
jgi:hypothetical protein